MTLEAFLLPEPAASAMRSFTLIPLKRTGCWKAKLMPKLARSVMLISVISVPLYKIRPEVGRSIPMISFARVDLPPPLGPVMAIKV